MDKSAVFGGAAARVAGGTAAQILGRVAGTAAVAASQGASAAKDVAAQGASAAKEAAETVSATAKAKKDKFKAEVKQWLLEIIFEQVEKLVARGPDVMKNALEDPDMPRCAKRVQDRIIDMAWPDIREEIMWEVAVKIDGKKDVGDPGSGPDCCRAFLRYHIYPHDKGIWGRLRDVVWVLFTLGSLIPLSGFYALVYFLLFLIIDKSDEFQMVQFVLQFKGTQFVSHGIFRTIIGFFMFVNCVSAGADEAQHSCERNGPGTAELYNFMYECAVAGWILQVVLVWVAYAFLRASKEKGRRQLKGRIGAEVEGENSGRKFEHTGVEIPGGYLKYFLIYDAVCFTVIVFGLFVVIALRPDGFQQAYDHWSIKHAFFSAQVIYGYLSMPFFIFLIPVLERFLTHSVDTAYDRSGRCVAYIGPQRKKDEEDGEKKKRWGAMFGSSTQDLSNRMPDVNEKLDRLYERVTGVLSSVPSVSRGMGSAGHKDGSSRAPEV